MSATSSDARSANDQVIRLDPWIQGPTGQGQGGWTSQRLVAAIGQPATVAIRAPIPLDTDLRVTPGAGPETWNLVDPQGVTILEASRWEPDYPTTAAVSIADARLARERFPFNQTIHPVPVCFACGLEPDSMKVHAGPLDDGRFATDWTVPDWAIGADGTVDEAVLWAALDCTAAIFAGCEGGIRRSVTAQLAVDVLHRPEPGAQYALVAWAGDWPHPYWDGRKRAAASAAFDETGRCIAVSRSFWIALE